MIDPGDGFQSFDDQLIILALIVLVVVALIGERLRRTGRRAEWLRREGMPEELRTARLVASERYYRCQKPVALSGTPDQVYHLPEGALVVVDTKRRPRAQVYDADIAQLSIYRVLLAAQKAFRGQPLAAYGYVRLVTPEGVVYRRVELWDTARVVALHRRYWALRDKRDTPTGAETAGLCRQCGHRERCGLAR